MPNAVHAGRSQPFRAACLIRPRAVWVGPCILCARCSLLFYRLLLLRWSPIICVDIGLLFTAAACKDDCGCGKINKWT